MSAPVSPASPPRPARWPSVAAAIALVAIALALYQPWRAPALPTIDFAEFIPILRQHHGFGERLHAVSAYYASRGRMSLAVYALMTLEWTTFGAHAAGWQWVRFAAMLAMLAACAWAFRRLGVRAAGILVATSLLVVIRPAAANWVRFASEPWGAALLLVALGVAATYRATPRPGRALVVMTACVVLALLCKETLVAVVPTILFVARWRQPDGGMRWGEWRRRDTALVLALGAATLAVMLPVLWVFRHADAASYSRGYGRVMPTAGTLLARLRAFVLPQHPGAGDLDDFIAFPGNALWLAAMMLGLVVAWREASARGARRTLAWTVTGALLLVIAGVAVYAPWPIFVDLYGLPYAIGVLWVAAVAADACWRAGRHVRTAAGALWVGVLLTTACTAYTLAGDEHIARALDRAVADALAQARPARLVVLTPSPDTGAEAWSGMAATWARDAALYGGFAVPDASERPCAAREAAYADPAAFVIDPDDGCGTRARATRRVSLAREHLWWDGVAAPDSMSIAWRAPTGRVTAAR